MPSAEYFCKKTLSSDLDIDRYFSSQSRVFHLVDLPDGKDYSHQFKTHWEEATELAMKDVDASDDAVVPEELPVDDVSHLVNVLLGRKGL